MRNFLQFQAAVTTTMFDFTRLHNSFLELLGLPSKLGGFEVEDIETAMQIELMNPSNFIPFIMKHEFEALVFSSNSILLQQMNSNKSQQRQFNRILQEFPNPKDINCRPNRSPSKRVQHIWPRYHKITHGVSALERIEVDTIRKRCPHFNCWVEKPLARS